MRVCRLGGNTRQITPGQQLSTRSVCRELPGFIPPRPGQRTGEDELKDESVGEHDTKHTTTSV